MLNMSRHPTTLYQAIASQLEQELNQYRCGDYLPPEKQLAAHYAVNRHTRAGRSINWWRRGWCSAVRG